MITLHVRGKGIDLFLKSAPSAHSIFKIVKSLDLTGTCIRGTMDDPSWWSPLLRKTIVDDFYLWNGEVHLIREKKQKRNNRSCTVTCRVCKLEAIPRKKLLSAEW